MVCILFWSSPVGAHDPQTYKKMAVTSESIGRIFQLREILLSFQTGFSLESAVSAAVVCAIIRLRTLINYKLSQGIWSLWLSQASVHVLESLCEGRWCCLSSAWSSRHWSLCRRLWRLCRDAQLILPVLLPLLLSYRCHQQSGDWWLFCLQCWQCLHDLLKRLSWSLEEKCWRGQVSQSDFNCFCSEPIPYAPV